MTKCVSNIQTDTSALRQASAIAAAISVLTLPISPALADSSDIKPSFDLNNRSITRTNVSTRALIAHDAVLEPDSIEEIFEAPDPKQDVNIGFRVAVPDAGDTIKSVPLVVAKKGKAKPKVDDSPLQLVPLLPTINNSRKLPTPGVLSVLNLDATVKRTALQGELRQGIFKADINIDNDAESEFTFAIEPNGFNEPWLEKKSLGNILPVAVSYSKRDYTKGGIAVFRLSPTQKYFYITWEYGDKGMTEVEMIKSTPIPSSVREPVRGYDFLRFNLACLLDESKKVPNLNCKDIDYLSKKVLLNTLPQQISNYYLAVEQTVKTEMANPDKKSRYSKNDLLNWISIRQTALFKQLDRNEVGLTETEQEKLMLGAGRYMTRVRAFVEKNYDSYTRERAVGVKLKDDKSELVATVVRTPKKIDLQLPSPQPEKDLQARLVQKPSHTQELHGPEAPSYWDQHKWWYIGGGIAAVIVGGAATGLALGLRDNGSPGEPINPYSTIRDKN